MQLCHKQPTMQGLKAITRILWDSWVVLWLRTLSWEAAKAAHVGRSPGIKHCPGICGGRNFVFWHKMFCWMQQAAAASTRAVFTAGMSWKRNQTPSGLRPGTSSRAGLRTPRWFWNTEEAANTPDLFKCWSLVVRSEHKVPPEQILGFLGTLIPVENKCVVLRKWRKSKIINRPLSPLMHSQGFKK